MDAYVVIMYCMSSFGFFIIFFSVYLLMTVPTKLTPLTQFVMHGHNLSVGIAQLYLTIGLQTHMIFPCASGYNAGLLSRLKIMRTFNQAWLGVALIATSAMFSLLLSLHRAFAVSVNISDKAKKVVLRIFMFQSLLQILCIPVVGVNLKDGGKEGRQRCIEKIKDYPAEMDNMNGVNLVVTQDLATFLSMVYALVFTTTYVVISGICGTVLVRSIRNQGKSTQSAKFLACQRRITVGVIYFMIVELVGVGIPLIIIALCICFSMGNILVSHCSMIGLCFYPICSPYYVLLANPDYRRKVHGIMTKALKITELSRPQPLSIVV